jgi:hypothetical protein
VRLRIWFNTTATKAYEWTRPILLPKP